MLLQNIRYVHFAPHRLRNSRKVASAGTLRSRVLGRRWAERGERP
jgi:hypothetical protein